jgi:hypothetical protein|tara:strand:- start:48 stop:359 length:312 start_codon:yes stop_codon:yes gene_type:complete
MAKYKERRSDDNILISYIRTADNACIPITNDNKDYRRVLAWINEGNTVAPADPKPVPTYADKRRAEYASVGDQLDMIYWDKINGTDNWETSINDVKTRFPKPE